MKKRTRSTVEQTLQCVFSQVSIVIYHYFPHLWRLLLPDELFLSVVLVVEDGIALGV